MSTSQFPNSSIIFTLISIAAKEETGEDGKIKAEGRLILPFIPTHLIVVLLHPYQRFCC